MRHSLDAWLGADLTDDQIERLEHEADLIDLRYPEPDEQSERDAALSAAVQYVLGETTPADAGDALNAARRHLAAAMAASKQIGSMAVRDGSMKKAPAAVAVAIDRMTLLTVLGDR